jgi:hypothetical protein
MSDPSTPVWMCPTCGYVCTLTWETRPPETPDCLFYERGKVLVALARAMPLWTVCIHPDGTRRDDRAPRRGTPAAAETRRPPEKDREDALLLALAGPIAAHLGHAITPQDYPAEFADAYDRLLDLPDTSPLVAHEHDLQLTTIQAGVIALLDAADPDVGSALLHILVQRHALTPAIIRQVVAHPPQVDGNPEHQG